MKSLALWTLLVAAVLPLTACHWHHHRHHFAEGYSEQNHAQTGSEKITRATQNS